MDPRGRRRAVAQKGHDACDEDKDRFEAKLGKIAKAKGHEAKKTS